MISSAFEVRYPVLEEGMVRESCSLASFCGGASSLPNCMGSALSEHQHRTATRSALLATLHLLSQRLLAATYTGPRTPGRYGLSTPPPMLACPCEKGILYLDSPPRQSAMGQEQLRGSGRHRSRISLRPSHTLQAVPTRSLRRAAHPLRQQCFSQGKEQEQAIMASQYHDEEAVFKGAQQACAG